MKSRAIVTVFILVLLVIVITFCYNCIFVYTSTPTPVHFNLNQEEVTMLTNRATEQKDLEAAERLSSYYRFTLEDSVTANKWDSFIKKNAPP